MVKYSQENEFCDPPIDIAHQGWLIETLCGGDENLTSSWVKHSQCFAKAANRTDVRRCEMRYGNKIEAAMEKGDIGVGGLGLESGVVALMRVAIDSIGSLIRTS